MDTAKYQDIVKQVIENYAALRPSHGNIQLEVVFDEVYNRYALMQVGWDGEKRVGGNLLYITLHDGKVYIEYDGIGHGITEDLISKGISEDDIVLAFLSETRGTAAA